MSRNEQRSRSVLLEAAQPRYEARTRATLPSDGDPPMRKPATATRSDSSRTEPYPPWSRVFAYNNLPPIPSKQLTTPAVGSAVRARDRSAPDAARHNRQVLRPGHAVPDHLPGRGPGKLHHRGHRDYRQPNARVHRQAAAVERRRPRGRRRAAPPRQHHRRLGPNPSAPRWRSGHARRPRAAACRCAADAGR